MHQTTLQSHAAPKLYCTSPMSWALHLISNSGANLITCRYSIQQLSLNSLSTIVHKVVYDISYLYYSVYNFLLQIPSSQSKAPLPFLPRQRSLPLCNPWARPSLTALERLPLVPSSVGQRLLVYSRLSDYHKLQIAELCGKRGG